MSVLKRTLLALALSLFATNLAHAAPVKIQLWFDPVNNIASGLKPESSPVFSAHGQIGALKAQTHRIECVGATL